GQPIRPLQPADYAARSNYPLRFALAVLLVAALALSGWFFWKWWRSSGESHQTAGGESTTASVEKSKTSAKPAPRKQLIKVSTNIVVRTNSVGPQSEALAQAVSSNSPISAPQTNGGAFASPTNVAAPSPPSPFADLKLQSIIFSEDKRAAGINGELLYVGDDIRGARVMRIDRQSV